MRPAFLLIASLIFAGAPVHESRATPIEKYAISTADELAIRLDIGKNAWTLLNQGKYNELNKLAEQYRVSGEKTPSGLPKLHLFYAGLYTPPKGVTLTYLQWGDVFLKIHMWIQNSPSPAASIALANLYIRDGWRTRGTGFANTVLPSQWETFFSEMHLAHQALDSVKTAASNNPEWYVSMAELAKSEDWPREQAATFFAEAIEKNKYYSPIYDEIMLDLLPQWNGSEKAMENFADHAVDNTKDRDGEELYARLYWYIAERAFASNASLQGHLFGDWEKIKAGFHDMLSRYPTAWNLNDFAYFACMEQDKETTKSLVLQIQKPILDIWAGKQEIYDQCRAWALAT